MSKNGLLAAVALAAGLDDEKTKTITVDAAFIKQNFAAVAAQLANEGADAEVARITAIDAAAMPGHEAIITAHKADRTKTAGDAALAINAAEKAKLVALKGSLVEDDKKLAGLTAAPTSGGAQDKPMPNAHVLAKAAGDYQAEQAKLGYKVSAAKAVAHVKQQLGVK